MKEITRINLASMPYNVEIGAKKELEQYCDGIQHNLGADTDEMREIEARMAELLAERGVVGEKVICSEDVAALRAQLGEAADFASQDVASAPVAPDNEKPVHRLMRDTSNRILGGVCSGIGQYFDIDPLLVRLVAVGLTLLSAGAGIFVYLLLWVIVPPARTAADRLKMAGRPVNITTIKDEANITQVSGEPVLVAFLRYLAIGCLVYGAIGILVGLWLATVSAAPAVFAQSPRYIFLTILGALASVFLAFLLGLVAYALIVKKFTQNMGTVIIAVMLAGLASYVVGVLGLQHTQDSPLSMVQVTKPLAIGDLSGIMQLTIESSGNVAVNYVTKAGKSNSATQIYPEYYTDADIPRVQLKKQGDTAKLIVSGGRQQTCREGCSFTLDIEGPVLERLEVNNGIVTYSQLSDPLVPLAITASGNANVAVNSDGQFESINLTAMDYSNINLAPASVVSVTGTLSQAGSMQLGHVSDINLTTPRVCPADQNGVPELQYASAGAVKINGSTYDASHAVPCLTVSRTSN